MINGLPFWKHPSTGWNASNRGLTEAQIRQWEDAVGCALPNKFRQLMAEQNGGELRRPVLAIGDGEIIEVSIDPAPRAPSSDVTLRDLVLHVLSEKELAAKCASVKPCYPERAVLISRRSGHDCLVLDYGWREEELKASPSVTMLSDAGAAFP